LTTYIALLRKDPDSDFGVDFPDFPGCITAGSTLEETRLMAQEALEGHVEYMIELGQAVPEPSSLEDVMADPENAEAIPFPVTLPDRGTKKIAVDLTFSEADLRKLDALAKKQGKSRSAVLAEATRRLIAGSEDHAA
jgi:predicted RNase H-like HicB family nuclease